MESPEPFLFFSLFLVSLKALFRQVPRCSPAARLNRKKPDEKGAILCQLVQRHLPIQFLQQLRSFVFQVSQVFFVKYEKIAVRARAGNVELVFRRFRHFDELAFFKQFL